MTGTLVAKKTGRMVPEERAAIEQMAERGLSAPQIAQRLNRHSGTINFAMHALGLKAPQERTFDYVRNGVRVVSFSREEDAFIEALRVQAFTTTKIGELCAKRFGHPRSAATVGTRLKMIANRELA